MALGGHVEVEPHADRVVIRCPDEPDYWDGNRVIFRGSAVRPDAQVAQFRADFPAARHVRIGWDAPGLEKGEGHSDLEARGFEIDIADVLLCHGAPLAAPVPQGISLREIRSDADWAQVEALQIETGLEEGQAIETYGPFVAGRCKVRRQQSGAGHGAWFGAFDGDLLVGDLGLMLGEGIARYQSVETRASHRGKGICPALLSMAAAWGLARQPDLRFVIIADEGGMPARLYRSRGFAFAETFLSALRPPGALHAEP